MPIRKGAWSTNRGNFHIIILNFQVLEMLKTFMNPLTEYEQKNKISKLVFDIVLK